MDSRFPINKFTLRFPPAFEREYRRERRRRDTPAATRLMLAVTTIGVVIVSLSWWRIGVHTIPVPSMIAQITLVLLPLALALANLLGQSKTYPERLPRIGMIIASACMGTMLAVAPPDRLLHVFLMCLAVIIVLMVTPLTFSEVFFGLMAFGTSAISGLSLRESAFLEIMPGLLSLLVFAAACIGVSSYMHDKTQRLAYLSGLALESEQEWSSKLLASILPRRFTDQLRGAAHDRRALVEAHAEVTIVFADLVGFTALAAKLSPHRLVGLLSELFSLFDQITERYGAEKIKTIGDAYLAVTGLTPQTGGQDHIRVAVDLALAFRDAVRMFAGTIELPLQIRIGIHAGPVVAGVIGSSRFHFDLWGEAVNMAARLESSGLADEIQVSTAVQDRLGQDYVVEPRRLLALKGIGDVDAFLVKSRRHP